MCENEKAKLKAAADLVLNPKTYWLLAPKLELVKIGKSFDPIKRMRDLRTMNAAMVEPLLVHRVPEAELHTRFKDLRHHGEWFTIEPDMVAYLVSIGEHDAADRLTTIIVLGG